MTKKNPLKIPAYCKHKHSGQAYITPPGHKPIYLGKHGTKESKQEYERLIALLLSNGGKMPTDERIEYTVEEVMAKYFAFVRGYYVKNGKPTREVASIREALRPLRKLYGPISANDFGPKCLKTLQQALIQHGYCRSSINKHVGRIRRMFKWCVGEELVHSSLYHGLQSVQGLRRGRTKAKDPKPIQPVEDTVVDATLQHVCRQVGMMIQLQALTGMRPGEVVLMRTKDLDRSGECWLYRPHSHKTEHFGKERIVYLGPKAQEILKSWLRADPNSYLFSPQEAEIERNQNRRAARKTPMTPSQRKRSPKKNPRHTAKDHYTVDSYRRAVTNACKRHEIPHWHPNQLRHTAATRIRKDYGLEAARVILGHNSVNTTEIYAEIDAAHALKVVEKIG